MINNAYDMLQLLRDDIDETTPSHWPELNLLRRLNQAYYEVYRTVANSSGQWLVKSTSVTATNGVITLPSDCAKPVYLEDSNGNPVSWLNSVAQRRVSRVSGATSLVALREAYPLKSTIEINEDSYSDTLTLWYQQKPVDLHAGTAAAGGATSLTLEASMRGNVQDDYYNNMEIEVISGTGPGRYTISDYAGSTRVCTLSSGTFGADSVYGLVPITPSECNDYIVLRASVLALLKPSSTLDKDVLQMVINEAKRAKNDMTEWLENRIIENVGINVGEAYL